eukprot:CAMPEP_0205908834 /NCGR_PEP_ID=MMETSP1325-20131115/3478_1 /ASSEMBLY_ACC=CAM_ASM_000708 /TAXON_ID=236786 /ORGANISM="Florenciella sp., Strain RCC1007" /LENGTH=37 /DNA_ID= /DNA_START= /DNA_END= /DNA_ORIENTATION=
MAAMFLTCIHTTYALHCTTLSSLVNDVSEDELIGKRV